ncbi:MAG: CSD domain-containing protein [Oscillospiraceae bacterium]|jgi:uncharacterized LabA/DUF88 family protein/cold shock CspA family protein
MSVSENKFLRIGVFYDGQYFFNVSNYYAYQHSKKSRISVSGLHSFIIQKISELTSTDSNLCQIVDAHYFRGRLSAKEADSQNKLYQERVFDDILMGENVITHYLPLRSTNSGDKQEKGIDVWLALEAYELAIYKRFDILVLIAGDGDYVPLVRKLSTLGTRVMLLCWDFKYTDENGRMRETRASQNLIEEVPYPVMMHEVIDNRVNKNDVLIRNLFVSKLDHSSSWKPSMYPSRDENSPTFEEYQEDEIHTSEIISINAGYGFIKSPPNNLFFHFSTLENCDFNELEIGMKVKYISTTNDGRTQAKKVWVIEE